MLLLLLRKCRRSAAPFLLHLKLEHHNRIAEVTCCLRWATQGTEFVNVRAGDMAMDWCVYSLFDVDELSASPPRLRPSLCWVHKLIPDVPA
jgi:hypothetical protein